MNSDCIRLQSNTKYLTIKNGRTLGERIVSGHVRPDGTIIYTRQSLMNPEAIGHFSGKLKSNEGSTTDREKWMRWQG
jgi:hypothetical protein